MRSNRVKRYRNRIVRNFIARGLMTTTGDADNDWQAAEMLWTEENQSAECLYLILGSGVINGVSALEMLNDRDIGDTDEDGMLEILDPWGEPVGFMRWPVGYYLTPEWNKVPTNEEIVSIKRKLGRESLDVVYSDPRYAGASTSTANYDLLHPFNVLPMVVSAGADGVFDLYGLDVPHGINYANMEFTGQLVPNPFTEPLEIVDPYLDGTTIQDQLGARLDTADTGVNNDADNIIPALSF